MTAYEVSPITKADIMGVETDSPYLDTMSLLRLTHAGRPKTLAFTSSVSTCLGTAAPASIPESPITSISSSPLVALNTGYAHSKYIIERLTQIASTQLNIPIRLLRVGQMCGNTKSGAWNVDEMWPIMFASSAKLGAVPMLGKGDGKRVDWIPVDVAGEAISEILLEPATPNPTVKYTVHNIVNPNPISWTSLVALLQKSGISSKPMEEISLSSWVGKLNDAVESGKDATEIPGLRLLQFFENMVEADGKEMGAEEEDRVFETMESRGVSAALRACPGFCGDWVEGNVKWWRYGGFC
jgi:thioester reductase-like protein